MDNEIIIDFTTLEFIRPAGVTTLYNIINWLLFRDVTVKAKTPIYTTAVRQRNPIKYLDDCGFFELFLGKKQFSYSILRRTTIPLKKVACEESTSWLHDVFVDWLMKILSPLKDPRGFSGIRACFQEIFDNIKNHSSRNTGCSFAQHYPNKNEIVVAISDFGVGIPYNVKQVPVHANVDDAQALELAIQEGFSTKTSPRNRGAGLEILFHCWLQASILAPCLRLYLKQTPYIRSQTKRIFHGDKNYGSYPTML